MQHVEEHQREERHLELGGHQAKALDAVHHEVAEAELDDAEAELHRDAGVAARLGQLDPHDGEDRTEDEDEGRVEELGRGCAHLPTEQVAVHVAFREEGEGGARLLKAGPENDVEREHHDHHQHAVAGHIAVLDGLRDQAVHHVDRSCAEQPADNPVVRDEQVQDRDGKKGSRNGELVPVQTEVGRRLQLLGVRWHGGVLVILPAEPEGEGTEDHAEAREGKAVLGAVDVADLRTHRGGQQGANIDADVEDGEAGIAAGIIIGVELADNRGDVGLEVAVAHDDGAHAHVEPGVGSPENEEFPDAHQDATEDHRIAVTQQAVGNPAAQHRSDIHQGSVGAVDAECLGIAHGEGFDQVKGEEGAHAVVAEALPHLGKEERVQATRMAALGHSRIRHGESDQVLGSR